MNIDSFQQLKAGIGSLRLKRCGSIPALTISVVYAPISNSDEEEVEVFYKKSEKFCREEHRFFKVINGDFNYKNGPEGRLENSAPRPTD
ncbi:unnamed protein product [Angiostrongylus costaricensis]|uniref:Uncharacterized protein n=1 Tax=Angiostrongylus costaricensis TaxID=334426 RepID=A0A0R3PM41_ANGCS|nr:unnamed protein product [Angiostrongylus costaricensis]